MNRWKFSDIEGNFIIRFQSFQGVSFSRELIFFLVCRNEVHVLIRPPSTHARHVGDTYSNFRAAKFGLQPINVSVLVAERGLVVVAVIIVA